MCTPMHQVLPDSIPTSTGALYVGSMSAVHDMDLLREHNITHLVQVLDSPFQPTDLESLCCYQINLRDTTTADLTPHLEAGCAWIDEALKTGGSVLVHCQQVCIFAHGFSQVLPPHDPE